MTPSARFRGRRFLDQLGTVQRCGCHGLFEKDVEALVDQAGRRAGVQVGRKQDVNHVEFAPALLEHGIE